MGRALQAGRRYQLVVSETLLTGNGKRLVQKHLKEFRAVDANMDSRKLSKWRVVAPPASTRDPLEIHLDGAFDHLSLAYRIRVKANDGTAVPGKIGLGENEKTWSFVPNQNWNGGTSGIVIESELEDICGNRIGQSFDHPVEEYEEDSKQSFTLNFDISDLRSN